MAQIATSTMVGDPIGEAWGLLRDFYVGWSSQFDCDED
jgi:hypothetical protein